MKNSILILILFIFIGACKKDDVNTSLDFKDGKLSDAIWKLNKMTTVDGVLIPNPDIGTRFENAEIFIEFKSNDTIEFTFSGLSGVGEYEIQDDNNISVSPYFDIEVQIYFESKYRDLFLSSMRDLDHYSIEDTELRLFYNGSKSIIHYTKM